MLKLVASGRRRSKYGESTLLAPAVVLLSVALLSSGGVAPAQSDDGAAALRALAGVPGNQEEIRRLREVGTAPDIPGSDGRTAFHEVILSGDLENLKALLQGDGVGNLNVQDINGDTPLHYLVAAAVDMDESEAFGFARVLLEAGAKPCVDNNRRCNVWEDSADAASIRRALELVGGMDEATCRGDPKKFKRILGCLDRSFGRPFRPFRPEGD